MRPPPVVGHLMVEASQLLAGQSGQALERRKPAAQGGGPNPNGLRTSNGVFCSVRTEEEWGGTCIRDRGAPAGARAGEPMHGLVRACACMVCLAAARPLL